MKGCNNIYVHLNPFSEKTIRWCEVRDSSQSFSSDTLQGRLYTEKKRSHWLKHWPIRKGLGDKKRRVVIGWNFVET